MLDLYTVTVIWAWSNLKEWQWRIGRVVQEILCGIEPCCAYDLHAIPPPPPATWGYRYLNSSAQFRTISLDTNILFSWMLLFLYVMLQPTGTHYIPPTMTCPYLTGSSVHHYQGHYEIGPKSQWPFLASTIFDSDIYQGTLKPPTWQKTEILVTSRYVKGIFQIYSKRN